MTAALLDRVRHCTLAHADAHGVARTAIAGLSTISATAPGELQYDISCPMLVLLLQGTKQVTFGSHVARFGAGESLLITADVPTTSQITGADARQPYYSFVLHLDPAIIASLVGEMDAVADAASPASPLQVEATEAEVADCALRLLQLLERPRSLPILRDGLLREMHHWLLAGRHGAAIRQLGAVNGHAARIGRAVKLIRAHYAQPLRVEHLAEVAGMSLTTFHAHFRAVTSLTPLQFQKQLRLVEARRLMRNEGAIAKRAAHAVGYESVTQFTREYGRLFGQPPSRDARDHAAAP
ncbi:AraC family transcriptional regulator [Stenotrophomonas sp. HITSZ_GD]|uniref:AraC family transcriptional regulator n=1 Tax=Stenotrophomonas sp. HITSZ_GD TaxID=3037248 RepID=UPI00240D8992|nr:AraC family transcriptional regulator [Stenotrophomonas sp. HITSZ_GD]MDG2523764.1 AraC family transcriptional regulator [Stenotrophomonas sp. HITSZ_GD]